MTGGNTLVDAELDALLTRVQSGDTYDISRFKFSQQFDTISKLQFTPENPHVFNRGDIIRFQFPEVAGSSYPHDFYGIVRHRDFTSREVTAYDFGTVLHETAVDFDKYKYVGEDFIMAILDIVDEVDILDLIDTSEIHGTNPSKYITVEDNIFSYNNYAWTKVISTLAKTYDDSNNYILPYHAWFEGKHLYIQKEADIGDSTNFPSFDSVSFTDISSIKYREDDDAIANRVTCTGLNGKQYTAYDTDARNDALSNDGNFNVREKVIKFDSANTDELQQKANDYINLRRVVRGEYEIELSGYYGIHLNNILNITGGEWGLDGRFVVTAISIDSNLRVTVTLSGSRLSLVDVI